jgi:hypothetical protein
MTPQDAHKIATDVHMKKYDECINDLYNIISYACNQGLYSIRKYNIEDFLLINKQIFEFNYNDIIIKQVLEELLEEGWTVSITPGEKIGFTIEW